MAKIGIRLDTSYLKPFAPRDEVLSLQQDVIAAHQRLMDGTGAGADYRGWLRPWEMADGALIKNVQETAADLRTESDALVVVGIGGSYLGARAVIEALAAPDAPPVYFAGINLSSDYHTRLLEKLQGKRVAVNVISKSGTTTEPAVAFRIFKEFVENTAGKQKASRLIVATTDARKGALRQLAADEGYRTYVVPDDVGGRFSVLSPVGLLPIAYAGIDIAELVGGAGACAEACAKTDLRANPAYYYAAARNLMYEKGFLIEMLSHLEPRLRYVAEWWKQLYGESEGKEGKGIFPASLELTADLHSMGQYAQQGRRLLMETFLVVAGGERVLKVPKDGADLDGMNYLAGRDMNVVSREAYRATALAHWEGGVPNFTIELDRLDARRLGELLYFYERACAVSGYLLRVNPFNQPGVEAYKRHMFALLGKPGFEQQSEAIRAKAGGSTKDSWVSFE